MSFTAQKGVEEEKIKNNHIYWFSHLKKIPVIFKLINFLNIPKEVKN